MATNGTDIVEQLRGRLRFYHVGDPVRRDMERACEEIDDLRTRVEAIVVDSVTGDGLSRVPSVSVSSLGKPAHHEEPAREEEAAPKISGTGAKGTDARRFF